MKWAFVVVFAGICLMCVAQNEFYNKGQAITIQPGALVYVQGTLTNTSTGKINCDGTVEIEGDIINDATSNFGVYSSGSDNRALKFVGSGVQHISANLNTPGAQSLYNVVIDQKSASSVVQMNGDLAIEGSLIFGHNTNTATYSSTNFQTTGSGGLLETFSDPSNPSNQYLLSIYNASYDAISGYPALALHTNPSGSYILTQGTRQNGTVPATFVGLQRKVNTLYNSSNPITTSYDYPVGTLTNGYNPLRIHFTSWGTGASGENIVAKFDDGTLSPSGFEGALSTYCNACNQGSQPLTPPMGGFNYFFSSNPCYSNSPLWVILQQPAQNFGLWSVSSTVNNSTYQYWLEAFPNSRANWTVSSGGTWRLLKYHYNGSNGLSNAALADFYYDASNDDWTTQATNVSAPDDLLTYTANTNCYSGSGIPGGIYTGFSHFGVFGENSKSALPVTIITLEANAVNNSFIRVHWATEVEINNKGFKVTRSTDGINFYEIGWADGHGNSTQIQDYDYDDYSVAPNVVYYYRLEQVDYNNKENETGLVQAMITSHDVFTIGELIPNPTANNSYIRINTSAQKEIEVRMFDELGRKVSADNYSLSAGDNEILIKSHGLSAGTYMIIIQADNNVYPRKLVVL
jgi:hypothetical protein